MDCLFRCFCWMFLLDGFCMFLLDVSFAWVDAISINWKSHVSRLLEMTSCPLASINFPGVPLRVIQLRYLWRQNGQRLRS